MARGSTILQRNRTIPPKSNARKTNDSPFLRPVSILSEITLGHGRVVFQVHPFLPLVASCGSSRVIQISSSTVDPEDGLKGGAMDGVTNHMENKEMPVPTLVVDQIIPPSPTNATALRWSPDGGWLAAMQQNSSKVVLWNLSTRESKSVDVHDKNLTFLAFSDATKGRDGGLRLAVGTSKGQCILFDVKTGSKVAQAAGGGGKSGKSKMVVGGDWGLEEDGCLGYWTNDSTIVLADTSGREAGTVSIQGLGGHAGLREISFSPINNRAFSIVTTKKKAEVSIMELSKDCKKKAHTELVFKSEWGEIVKAIWMPNGSLLIGFKAGYIVNMDEANRAERFAGKFLPSDETPLIDMAYHPTSENSSFGSIAIATKKKVKLVYLSAGKGMFEVCEWAVDEPNVLNEPNAMIGNMVPTTTCIDNIAFTKSGLVCASTTGGSILLFEKAKGGMTLLMACAEKMVVLFSDFPLDISATAFMVMSVAVGFAYLLS